MRLALRLALLFALTQSAFAQTAPPAYADPIALINAGLTAYKEKGPEEAMRVWIKGSPIDGSKDALNQANNLRTIETYYGSYQTTEILKVRDISKDVKVVYLVMDYATGPVFGRFVVYHSTKGWLLTRFNFNVDDTTVFGDIK
jgi:hypothetical protein